MLQKVLNPGATIGILGGGQLGMMTANRAMELGYQVVIFAPPGDTPATELPGVKAIVAEYGNEEALARLAEDCDVVTSEFENIPVATLAFLEKLTPVRPGPGVLRIAQDRFAEKDLFQELKLPTLNFTKIESGLALPKATPFPTEASGRLKTRTLGYDGKGQVEVSTPEQLEKAWESLGYRDCVLEKQLEFRCELSVIVARNELGNIAYLGPFENHHAEGILRETFYPAKQIDSIVKHQAIEAAIKIAKHINLCGLLAVEMFVTRLGAVLMNEIAPRPHNSGHLSIEAFDQSQYDLLIKAICNQPLTDPPKLLCNRAKMINILGQDISRSDLIANGKEAEGAKSRHVYIYGKKTAKAGRKMGHVTLVY